MTTAYPLMNLQSEKAKRLEKERDDLLGDRKGQKEWQKQEASKIHSDRESKQVRQEQGRRPL